MDLRFVAMITGCMLIGAGAAAYHRADGLFASRAALASGTPDLPLFMQAAVGAPAPAPWPSSGGAVTFHDEMLALRAALAVTPAQTPRADTADTGGEPSPVPPRAAAAPETSDTVEVVIRDRFGRPIRIERIDRRRLVGGGANPPPVPPRFYGSTPYAPYGYPYRR